MWCCRDKLDLFALPLNKNKIKFLSWHQRSLASDFKKFKGFYGLTFCGVLLSPLGSEIEEKKIFNCENEQKDEYTEKMMKVYCTHSTQFDWGLRVQSLGS